MRSTVVPYVGTWIEINCLEDVGVCNQCRSLRGNVDRNILKSKNKKIKKVVPYMGTWIEIPSAYTFPRLRCVVPYVGTWIEIMSAS